MNYPSLEGEGGPLRALVTSRDHQSQPFFSEGLAAGEPEDSHESKGVLFGTKAEQILFLSVRP